MIHLRRLAIPATLLSLTLLSGVAMADNGNHYGEIKKGGRPSSVPELSIGAAGAALVIIVGGTLIARGRRRRADKK